MALVRQFAHALPLVPGDSVAVVAPSSAPPVDKVALGLGFLEQWGLVPEVFHPDGGPDGYLAASDEVRLRSLNLALSEPRFKAVWCARGGYGLCRIAQGIRFPARARPPVLLGFSDASLLLALAVQRAGWPCIHGPNMTTLSSLRPGPLEALEQLLCRGRAPRFSGLETVGPGRAAGPLLAMNLAILASVVGTPCEPDLSGKLLVLEDTNEPPYRVDRLLWQVARSSTFAGTRGLVLGDLDGAQTDARLRKSIADLAREFDLPCVMGLPCGHTPNNYPLPLGSGAVMDADQGVLFFD